MGNGYPTPEEFAVYVVVGVLVMLALAGLFAAGARRGGGR